MTNGQKSIKWVARVVVVVYVLCGVCDGCVGSNYYERRCVCQRERRHSSYRVSGVWGLLEVEVEVVVAVKSVDEIVCNVGKLNSTW